MIKGGKNIEKQTLLCPAASFINGYALLENNLAIAIMM